MIAIGIMRIGIVRDESGRLRFRCWGPGVGFEEGVSVEQLRELAQYLQDEADKIESERK